MRNISYIGPFRDYLKHYVELKQALGYKYDTEADHLKRFDKFTLAKYPQAITLTREIILDWCSKKAYEAQANQCSRTSIIRQFSKYLDSIGVKAYVIPKGYYPTEKQYTPYIYTVEELEKLFAQTDRCKYCYECPNRHLIMPIIFRLIYACGLRLSEARLLKVADVDLRGGILTINHSKKDNSRLVPMPEFLAERCRDFANKVHQYSTPEEYYFYSSHGKPRTLGNVYHNFRRFLWHAKISHCGRGYGPRIHDLRHTYAVHCLKKWVKQGKDLMVYLPILKTYMGHDSFAETAYYLHLTADVFPDITLKIETKYPGIIPQLAGGENETN